jgi:hypothetical protein
MRDKVVDRGVKACQVLLLPPFLIRASFHGVYVLAKMAARRPSASIWALSYFQAQRST